MIETPAKEADGGRPVEGKKKDEKKDEYQDPEDFFTTKTRGLRLMTIAYFAGCIASLCGIGGGMVNRGSC